MGGSSSREEERPSAEETEIVREPDITDNVPPPVEERVNPKIVENLEEPLDDDKFVLGVESVSSEYRLSPSLVVDVTYRSCRSMRRDRFWPFRSMAAISSLEPFVIFSLTPKRKLQF